MVGEGDWRRRVPGPRKGTSMTGLDGAGVLLWAFQGAEKGAETPEAPAWGSLAIPFALPAFAFYFLIILPEGRKNKQRLALLSAIKKGDQVVTSSGILGVVANVK